MSSEMYRVIEVVGTSPDGVEEAIGSGINRASTTLRHLEWFEVAQVRGQVLDDSVQNFQTSLRLGFDLEEH
jgi:flavin-binding protein dodecin